MATKRVRDDGRTLWAFRGSIDVCCPSCGGRALVLDATEDRPARVTCAACAFATTSDDTDWLGPVRGVVRRRCPSCGTTILRTFPGPRHEHSAHLVCDCGFALEHPVTWDRVLDGPVDPLFGLPLWLREPCKGEVLWAYNGEHLEQLRAYVAADLRERKPNHNRSMASRLPRWMTAAKNRDAVLAAIAKLETRL